MPSERAWALMSACRMPESYPLLTEWGPWTIRRSDIDPVVSAISKVNTPRARAFLRDMWGHGYHTTLERHHIGTLMRERGEIVMEDSPSELKKHLPILLAASGRVLITGLGLGCVVRGLLSKPEVTHIDVVEIDEWILRVVGREFAGNPRVTLHHGDAEFYRGFEQRGWDFGWHDIWSREECWDVIHVRLLARYHDGWIRQGAWALPKDLKRVWPWPLLGGRHRRSKRCAPSSSRRLPMAISSLTKGLLPQWDLRQLKTPAGYSSITIAP